MELGFRVETALRKKWGSDWKEIQEVFKALCSIYIYIFFFWGGCKLHGCSEIFNTSLSCTISHNFLNVCRAGNFPENHIVQEEEHRFQER